MKEIQEVRRGRWRGPPTASHLSAPTQNPRASPVTKKRATESKDKRSIILEDTMHQLRCHQGNITGGINDDGRGRRRRLRCSHLQGEPAEEGRGCSASKRTKKKKTPTTSKKTSTTTSNRRLKQLQLGQHPLLLQGKLWRILQKRRLSQRRSEH